MFLPNMEPALLHCWKQYNLLNKILMGLILSFDKIRDCFEMFAMKLSYKLKYIPFNSNFNMKMFNIMFNLICF